jgi:hypothetical protein
MLKRFAVILLNLFLPNRAFRREASGLDKHSRRTYWALRIALAILAFLVILYFGIQQHPQLR